MPEAELGPSHRNRILQLLLSIEREMSECEAKIAMASREAAFARFVNDLSPADARTVEDHFERIRSAIQTDLRELGIPLELRKTSLQWALESTLMHLQVLVDDLSPKGLSAYGQLGAGARESILRVQHDLRRLITHVLTLLRSKSHGELEQKLSRLSPSSSHAAMLARLQEIVARRGLVEFGPVIEQIVDRLENPRFEIAFFGRVSSGKSSLINHLVGSDVLPVGVTPVTAVPTRITVGTKADAIVQFTDAPAIAIHVERLSNYVTEAGNPRNHKHVRDVLVRLPSDRLKEGVVLVDTPGVGSLALQGAAEALAYLPRCDLGVVLFDAASSLNRDDLALVRRLHEASVPAMLLLSKADLLANADLQRVIEYARAQVAAELGLDLAVEPVSTCGAHESLLSSWYSSHVRPLMDSHAKLADASIRRKIAAARASVLASLELLRERGMGHRSDGDDPRVDERAKQLLDEADTAIREANDQCLRWGDVRSSLVDYSMEQAARAAASLSRAEKARIAGDSVVADALSRVLLRRGAEAAALALRLWEKLVATLESLVDLKSPLTAALEVTGLKEARPTGLPPPDFSSLQGVHLRRPIWAGFAPSVAIRGLVDQLERHHGSRLRDAIEFEDRRIQAWLSGTLENVIAHYEAQASLPREQLRRLSPSLRGGDGQARGVPADLDADIAALATGEEPVGAESVAATMASRSESD